MELSACSIKHLGSNQYYIRHIFNALREHRELLENHDYKRLYDEVEDYLFQRAVFSCGWDQNNREWGYSVLELLADLSNSNRENSEHYSMETVDSFLAERKKIWNL